MKTHHLLHGKLRGMGEGELLHPSCLSSTQGWRLVTPLKGEISDWG